MGKGLVIGAVIRCIRPAGIPVERLASGDPRRESHRVLAGAGHTGAEPHSVLAGWVSVPMFGAHRRMHERWMNMTPNSEAFIQQRSRRVCRHGRGHCGWHGHRDDKHDDNAPKTPEAE